MASSRTLTAVLCGLSVAACSPGDRQPTGPLPSLDAVSAERADEYELEDVDRQAGGHWANQSATGSGHITAGGEQRTFSFSAVRHRDGTVSGQFQLKNRATDVVIHGEVRCMAIFPRPGGGAAFMAGVVTRVEGDATGFFEGRDVIFNAFDNGEGQNAVFPDFISLVQASNPQTAARQCAFGLRVGTPVPVEDGNVQVRP